MKIRRFRVAAALLAALLAAPAVGQSQSRPHVNSTVTINHSDTESHKGETLAVVAFEQAIHVSSGFRHFRGVIEQNLRRHGFRITDNPAAAKLLAIVSYGLKGEKGGKDTLAGPGTVFGPGGALEGRAKSGFTFPVYANKPAATGNQTRQLAMDIVKANTLKTAPPEKIYEVRLDSRGRCGLVSEVLDEMLLALFKEFPGNSGDSNFVTIYEASYNC